MSELVMATFTVVDRERPTVVLLATDDWLAAETFAHDAPWRKIYDVRGTHPSHEWDDQWPRRCRACGGWDNGSYGSHAPCGYVFEGSLVHEIERHRPASPVVAPSATEAPQAPAEQECE